VMGAVAVLMLLTGGENALDGIQNLTILVAAPFVIIMVLLCFALFRDLRRDPVVLRELKGAEVIEQAVDWATDRHGDDFFVKVGAFPKDGSDDEDLPNGYANGPGTGPGYTMTEPGEGPVTDGDSDRKDSPVGGD
ncbi:BCCT family transporter, partial [Pseudonocardia autotrophica]